MHEQPDKGVKSLNMTGNFIKKSWLTPQVVIIGVSGSHSKILQ